MVAPFRAVKFVPSVPLEPAHYVLAAEAVAPGRTPDISALAKTFDAACKKEGFDVKRGVGVIGKPVFEFALLSGAQPGQFLGVMEDISAQTGDRLFVAPSRPLGSDLRDTVLSSTDEAGTVKRLAILKSTP